MGNDVSRRQVLLETIDYTFGSDEISQTVREYDADGNITSEETHITSLDMVTMAAFAYSMISPEQFAPAAIPNVSCDEVVLSRNRFDGYQNKVYGVRQAVIQVRFSLNATLFQNLRRYGRRRA